MSNLTRLKLLASVGLALLAVVGLWLGILSVADATDGSPVSHLAQLSPAAPSSGASLHNPTFDNHIWYEFDLRYQHAYPSGSWLPDDDTRGGPQDWRLWFLDGTAIVESDPESVYAHFEEGEGIQMRPYDWTRSAHQVAGIYQVVYNTTPGYFYEFQLYGQSRPEEEYRDAVIKVGIDQVGWHPDSRNDPAVHGDFPSTTIWGPVHDYKWEYGPLTATVKAQANQITVFAYADAPGGRVHRILWDTGSFNEVGPDLIPDPDAPPVTGGITNVDVTPGRTNAVISWRSPGPAMGQIYYRLLSVPYTPGTVTLPMTYTIYLPYVSRETPWQSTSLEPTYTRTHSKVISGLEPGGTYEFIVASHGHGQDQFATWVAPKSTFTTIE